MPTGAMHSHYWAASPGAPAPPGTGASANGGYIPWMTTVTVGSGFGVMQVAWSWLVERATTTQPTVKQGS